MKNDEQDRPVLHIYIEGKPNMWTLLKRVIQLRTQMITMDSFIISKYLVANQNCVLSPLKTSLAYPGLV
jgi:hypothetical protein